MWVDYLKTWVLLLTLTFFVLIFFFALAGAPGLTIALLIMVALDITAFFYSDKLILKIFKARKSSYSEKPELHELIRELSTRAKIKTPQVYIIPSNSPNAFATGRPRKPYLAITNGLLSELEDQELRGALAHEIAHLSSKDILLTTVSSFLAAMVLYLTNISRPFNIFFKNKETNIIETTVFSILAPISATLINLTIPRMREFSADKKGAEMIKDPKIIGEALIKIHSTNRKIEFGNPALANLFITNPYRSSILINLMSTHPTLQSRLKRLRKMAFSQ